MVSAMAPRPSTGVGASQDLALEPRFDYTETLGCGDVSFHGVNAARTEILQVEADFARLGGQAGRRVFDLSKPPAGVVVTIALYAEPQVNRPNCRDVTIHEVGKPIAVPVRWQAVRGRLVVDRGLKGIRPDEPWLFRATLRLEGVMFRSAAGQTMKMERPFTWEGDVGCCFDQADGLHRPGGRPLAAVVAAASVGPSTSSITSARTPLDSSRP
jgi:hypothetical protein